MPARLREVISCGDIQRRVRELAVQIGEFYGAEPVLAVCVLKGAFLFFSDLTRALTYPVQVEFVRLSSYGADIQSSGAVALRQDLCCDIQGRHVLVVEDIVDSGLSLRFLLDELAARKPASLRSCALVDKLERRKTEVNADFVGFQLDKGFLVGYGLDYAEDYRTLDALYELEFSD
jgi:hypoxanthine phosphoribosyltransferase